MRSTAMFLFVNVLLVFFLPLSYTFDPHITDVDLYGPMLAANQHLVVSILDRTYPSFAVYRPYNSSEFCRFDMNITGLNRTYVMQLVVPNGASAAPDVFFYQAITIGNGVIENIVIVRVNIILMPICNYSSQYQWLNDSVPADHSVLGVSTMGDIVFYFDRTITYMYNYSIPNYSYILRRPLTIDSSFIYYAMDMTDNRWGVIAGVVSNNGLYVPTLYLINFSGPFNPGNFNYVVLQVWQATFVFPWQSQKARIVSGSTDFDSVYDMSLSINQQGDILFGVQSMNTVFRLYVNPSNPTSFTFISSRIGSTTTPSIGFGKAVAWLDNSTAVILVNDVSLDYTEWRSSKIEIYDLSNGKQLNNTQTAYSSFPTAMQAMYSILSSRIVLMVASYVGSVIFMDSTGYVYIILPSPASYYSGTAIGNIRGPSVYYSAPAFCPEGTEKQGSTQVKYLFDTCKLCPAGTYNPGIMSSTNSCLPCDTTQYFCPFGSVAQVPLNYLDKFSQAVAFPKSPDLTGFEDILLLNMFNTHFEANCLVTTPFFWTLIMIGIATVFLITMGIIKLTGKCHRCRTKIEMVLKHFDILNEGERWIGGVLSLSILLIIIFAIVFTSSFLKQYPNETSREPDFTCDETLRNSKFSSHMRSLGAAISDESKAIFDLLAVQKFTLIVTLLNTIVNTNITVTKIVSTISATLPRNLSIPTNGCLTISSDLTANIATIIFNISSPQVIGGIRIGLYGPEILDNNNKVKELNFSYSFSMSDRTMSQEPYFNIELIQVINETKPLSTADGSQYSGLWIPTFSKDDDRNFQTLNDYETFHTQQYTILTIDLTQAAYYIYNVERPIIKTAGVIFKNILFASICMEIFGFGFLFFKLAVVPLVGLIVRVVRPNGEGSKEKNEDEESKKEEEHKSDDDEEEEMSQTTNVGLGENQWYTPDSKI